MINNFPNNFPNPKNIFTRKFFIIVAIIAVIILIFSVSVRTNIYRNQQFGPFTFIKKNDDIKYFTKGNSNIPVTYTSVFSVYEQKPWVHVAAMRSRKTSCMQERAGMTKEAFYLFYDDMKYYLLNTRTGTNSGPLTELEYIEKAEDLDLTPMIRNKPKKFDRLELITVEDICTKKPL